MMVQVHCMMVHVHGQHGRSLTDDVGVVLQ